MVVQSHDTIPGSVYRDAHSVLCRKLAVPPICLAVALAHSDWDPRNLALETVLRQKICNTTKHPWHCGGRQGRDIIGRLTCARPVSHPRRVNHDLKVRGLDFDTPEFLEWKPEDP